ncbi:hypothetical protein ACFL2K_05380 [Candidatus Margulisiibacteriota bacterium]
MSDLLKFICPKCKSTKLNEKQTKAVVIHPIDFIDTDEYLEYNLPQVVDTKGETYFQCSECGWKIKNGRTPLTGYEDVVKWLKKQEYNKPKKMYYSVEDAQGELFHTGLNSSSKEEAAEAIKELLSTEVEEDEEKEFEARSAIDILIGHAYGVIEHEKKFEEVY